MESLSLQESLDRIETGESFIIFYTKKGLTIPPTMEQVCTLVEKHTSDVPVVRVEIDESTLTREQAQILRIMRVPQLRFYANAVLLGAFVGSISPSEVYEKILALYTED